MAYRLLKWLLKEIKWQLEAWKDKLQQNAIDPLWPKVVFAKLILRKTASDPKGTFHNRRWIFNKTLEKLARKFRGFSTINPDCIIPADEAMYSSTLVGYVLSETGFHYFCRQVDDLIRNQGRKKEDARIITEENKLKNFSQANYVKPSNPPTYNRTEDFSWDVEIAGNNGRRNIYNNVQNYRSNTRKGYGRGSFGWRRPAFYNNYQTFYWTFFYTR